MAVALRCDASTLVSITVCYVISADYATANAKFLKPDALFGLEAVTAPDPETDYPLLIEAVGACPPDDVGGVGGYRQFVAAMTDPDAPDHKRLRRWYGRPFDPDHVDVPMIRQRLTELKHRWSSRPS